MPNIEGRYYVFTVESQVIDHVKTALRNTLASDVERMGLPRKMSAVQFVTESLLRHLERLLDLEDEVGLLDPEEAVNPRLQERATSLRRQHQQLRIMLHDLDAAVAELTVHDELYFLGFCRNVTHFLDEFDKHELAEHEVLCQIYSDDEGGEG